MRMGIADQLELFGAGCRPMTALAHWIPPTPRQVIRERIGRQIEKPVQRQVPIAWEPASHEDPERWDGLG